MARLRDVPVVVREVGLYRLAKNIWWRIGDDQLFTWASALAYSWLFAIFPFFLFLISLIPYLRDDWKQEAKHQLAVAVYQLPKEAADSIWINISKPIDEILQTNTGGIASLGLLLTIWAASGGMAMTMAALDKCYDVKRPRPYYKQRPLAVLLTIVTATLILGVIVLIPIGTLAKDLAVKYLAEAISLPLLALWQVARYSLAFVFLFTVLAMIYFFGANVKQKWHAVTPGSVFCVALWLLLGVAFRFYIEHFGKYSQTYGTVGGVVILLFLFYLDALILLIGGEINCEIDSDMSQILKGEEPVALKSVYA